MWPFRRHVSLQRLDGVLLDYVRRQLPGRIGLPASAMGNVALRTFVGERPSYVRYVGIPVYGRLVLRVFLRRRHLQRLVGYRRLRWTYDKLGLPVPKTVFIDDMPATWRRYGFALLAEEFIDGEPIDELPLAKRLSVQRELASVVARLHGVTSTTPGRPWAGNRHDVRAHAAAQLGKWLARLVEFGADVDSARSRALTGWYASTLAKLAPQRFPLIHSRLTSDGVVVARGGRPVLVGMLDVEHWFAQWDLLFLEWLVEGEGTRSEETLRAYFSACEEGAALTQDVYEASRPVFIAAYCVHRASNHARNAMRDRLVPFEQAELARNYWARAQEALSEAGAP